MEKLDYQPLGMPADLKSTDAGQTYIQTFWSILMKNILLVKNGKRLFITFGYQPVSMTLA